MIRSSAIAIASATALWLTTLTALTAQAADRPEHTPVRAIDGSLVLAGSDAMCDGAVDVFVHLCGGAARKIVVLESRADGWVTQRLRERGAVDVVPMRTAARKLRTDEDALLELLAASGVWIEDPESSLLTDRVGRALLASVLARGGVLGGAGAAAVALTRAPKKGVGAAFLPAAEFVPTRDGRAEVPDRKPALGLVQWRVPPEAALVIHTGRRVCAYGPGVARVRIAAKGDWPARAAEISPFSDFDPQEGPSYKIDLLAWVRDARQRLGPVFPPAKPQPPRVKKGAMVLHGGRGVDDATFERFVKGAGGSDARIVCIPSADSAEVGQQPDSYSSNRLRKLGCTNLAILHATDPTLVDADERQLASLREATGVWIDGGRTYRVMDSYEHTVVQRLLADVLARGGVVGGSSAGCQVVGDFLVRGNPRTNEQLVFDGYTRGLGLLTGVVVDAHFRQRERGQGLADLVAEHSQLLGIGVDEKTALWIEGSVGTVLGENAVSFYVHGSAPTVLESGAKFDLVRRAPR